MTTIREKREDERKKLRPDIIVPQTEFGSDSPSQQLIAQNSISSTVINTTTTTVIQQDGKKKIRNFYLRNCIDFSCDCDYNNYKWKSFEKI